MPPDPRKKAVHGFPPGWNSGGVPPERTQASAAPSGAARIPLLAKRHTRSVANYGAVGYPAFRPYMRTAGDLAPC